MPSRKRPTPARSLRFAEITDAELRGDRWAVVEPALTGICGSDQKQILLKGNFDSPLSGVISFPHVLGHESAGVVVETGKDVATVQPGARVVINPWLSCEPRGITPVCASCASGTLALCENFERGELSPGLHLGNCTDAPGAFASRVAVHESQLFRVPDAVTWEQAVLADPFGVAFHAVVKDPPEGDAPTMIVGMKALGG